MKNIIDIYLNGTTVSDSKFVDEFRISIKGCGLVTIFELRPQASQALRVWGFKPPKGSENARVVLKYVALDGFHLGQSGNYKSGDIGLPAEDLELLKHDQPVYRRWTAFSNKPKHEQCYDDKNSDAIEGSMILRFVKFVQASLKVAAVAKRKP
jgi:hypothetical protein